VYDKQTVLVSSRSRFWAFAWWLKDNPFGVSHVLRTAAGGWLPAGEPGDFLPTPQLQDGPRQLCDSMGFISSLETARTPTPSLPSALLHLVCTSNARTVQLQYVFYCHLAASHIQICCCLSCFCTLGVGACILHLGLLQAVGMPKVLLFPGLCSF